MDALIKQRAENISAIHDAIDDLVRYAHAHSNIIKIVQFGSTVRGRVDAFSDLDVLVVMDTDMNFFDRNAEIKTAFKAPVDADIICYTPDEIDKNRHRPFFSNILREGKIIYEK